VCACLKRRAKGNRVGEGEGRHPDIDGVVPDEYIESHQLALQVMTLPCDGRYDIADMERMVAVLKGECGL
jgi:hypothetical protein